MVKKTIKSISISSNQNSANFVCTSASFSCTCLWKLNSCWKVPVRCQPITVASPYPTTVLPSSSMIALRIRRPAGRAHRKKFEFKEGQSSYDLQNTCEYVFECGCMALCHCHGAWLSPPKEAADSLSFSCARARALSLSFQGTFFSAFSLHLLSVYSTPSRALPVVDQSVIYLLRISAAVFIVSTCGSAFLFWINLNRLIDPILDCMTV